MYIYVIFYVMHFYVIELKILILFLYKSYFNEGNKINFKIRN